MRGRCSWRRAPALAAALSVALTAGPVRGLDVRDRQPRLNHGQQPRLMAPMGLRMAARLPALTMP